MSKQLSLFEKPLKNVEGLIVYNNSDLLKHADSGQMWPIVDGFHIVSTDRILADINEFRDYDEDLKALESFDFSEHDYWILSDENGLPVGIDTQADIERFVKNAL